MMNYQPKYGDTYVDRGEVSDVDFYYATAHSIGAWGNIPTSLYVPVGAKAVVILGRFQAVMVSTNFVMFKPQEQVNDINVYKVQAHHANVNYPYQFIIPLGVSRDILQWIGSNSVTAFELTVVGWFI